MKLIMECYDALQSIPHEKNKNNDNTFIVYLLSIYKNKCPFFSTQYSVVLKPQKLSKSYSN